MGAVPPEESESQVVGDPWVDVSHVAFGRDVCQVVNDVMHSSDGVLGSIASFTTLGANVVIDKRPRGSLLCAARAGMYGP